MQYQKPPLTLDEQVVLLKSRGLIISDPSLARHYLYNISYYRLGAYFSSFQNGDQFQQDTSFESIIDLYDFDRKLRFLIYEAIEAIEVSFRTRMAYRLIHEYGPFGYVDSQNVVCQFKHKEWLHKLQLIINESSEVFVGHYRKKYSSSQDLPLWMALELASFGGLSHLFRNLRGHDQTAISKSYQLPTVVFSSWLHVLVYVRNLCAHHSRLWNRVLTLKPKLLNNMLLCTKVKKGHTYSVNDRVYSVLIILEYLLQKINPNSDWKNRLIALLNYYPSVSVSAMGFPEGWERLFPWGTDWTAMRNK